MRSPKLRGVLLASLFFVSGPLAFAQSAKPTADPAPPKAATEEEVQQLRREVAELKAQIQQLVMASTQFPRQEPLTSSKPTQSSIPRRQIPLRRPPPLRQTTSTPSKKRSIYSRRSPTTLPRSPQDGTASTFS